MGSNPGWTEAEIRAWLANPIPVTDAAGFAAGLGWLIEELDGWRRGVPPDDEDE